MKAYRIPLLLLLLIVTAYFIHTRSCGCFRRAKPVASTISGSGELKKLLEAASMEDNTVILTLLDHQNPDSASLLNLFLQSFRLGVGTERFLNHLIILSTANLGFHNCKSAHPHCYNLATSGGSKKSLKDLNWRKNIIMEQVLDLGYSIFYTDMDVLWLRNPFPHLNSYDVFAVAHQCFINAKSEGITELPDAWLFYLKSHELGTEIIKLWNFQRFLYPDSNGRSSLEMLQNWSKPDKGIKLFDPTFFSCFCEGFIDLDKACIVRPICEVESECKPNDLELVLSHWRNFTASSALHSD